MARPLRLTLAERFREGGVLAACCRFDREPGHVRIRWFLNSTALGRVPCASFELGERDAELS